MPCGDGIICCICGYWHEPGRSCIPYLVEAALIEPKFTMPWPPREKDRCGYCGERHILTIERCSGKAEVDRADAPIRPRAYGLCRLCHDFHVDGPCPQVAGEREYRRKALIEQAVRDATAMPVYRYDWPMVFNVGVWAALLQAHNALGAEHCRDCSHFLAMVRTRFSQLVSTGATA